MALHARKDVDDAPRAYARNSGPSRHAVDEWSGFMLSHQVPTDRPYMG